MFRTIRALLTIPALGTIPTLGTIRPIPTLGPFGSLRVPDLDLRRPHRFQILSKRRRRACTGQPRCRRKHRNDSRYLHDSSFLSTSEHPRTQGGAVQP
jgi:hypothetical protein